MSNKCGSCDKPVYAAEERRFGDVAYHKQCFKCSLCNKPVDSTTGAQHQRTLYCKTCHGREFGPKGYGFGQGAGVLNTEKATKPGTEGGAASGSKPGQPRAVSPKSGGCPRCGQRVYDAEKAIGCPGDLKFHKRCFRCQTCGKSLDSTNLATKDLEIYCKSDLSCSRSYQRAMGRILDPRDSASVKALAPSTWAKRAKISGTWILSLCLTPILRLRFNNHSSFLPVFSALSALSRFVSILCTIKTFKLTPTLEEVITVLLEFYVNI